MSRKYKIHDQERAYFVTFTVIHWIDFFIRNEYRQIFIDSVKYCQAQKGLEVFAWCIMTSHIHMIIKTDGRNRLQDIIRDLKSFTSRSARKALENWSHIDESRREWLLHMMYRAGKYNSNNNDYQFWQQHNNPIELNTNELMDRTLEYIHMNPVKAGFVDAPESWVFSSARDYYLGVKGPIELVFME
jgi:REP element-mobilizing transposase RayT